MVWSNCVNLNKLIVILTVFSVISSDSSAPISTAIIGVVVSDSSVNVVSSADSS